MESDHRGTDDDRLVLTFRVCAFSPERVPSAQADEARARARDRSCFVEHEYDCDCEHEKARKDMV